MLHVTEKHEKIQVTVMLHHLFSLLLKLDENESLQGTLLGVLLILLEVSYYTEIIVFLQRECEGGKKKNPVFWERISG